MEWKNCVSRNDEVARTTDWFAAHFLSHFLSVVSCTSALHFHGTIFLRSFRFNAILFVAWNVKRADKIECIFKFDKWVCHMLQNRARSKRENEWENEGCRTRLWMSNGQRKFLYANWMKKKKRHKKTLEKNWNIPLNGLTAEHAIEDATEGERRTNAHKFNRKT